MSTGPRSIPGRTYVSYKDELKEKYRKVEKMDGKLDMREYHKRSDEGDNYFEVIVKLELKRELTDEEGWQTLLVGTGRDEKDKKGAYVDLLRSELDVHVERGSDERAVRQMAHNVINQRYKDAAITNEVVKDGKAIVEVKVKNWSLVAQGTGDSLNDAYKSAIPAA